MSNVLFNVNVGHVPSLFPTPLCEKTYVSELLGSNVVPAQPDVSPYTGFVYFCVLKVDNYVVVKGEWKHKIKYSKIIYKIDIPDIINVVEIRLYVGEAGKRGLPVANLIKPNVHFILYRQRQIIKRAILRREPLKTTICSIILATSNIH